MANQKKSNSYWERRSEEGLLNQLKDADKILKTLKTDYDLAIKNINDEIAKLYGKFAKDNQVDPEEAREVIKGNEYKKWRMSMQKYLDGIVKGDEALQFELNVLCMRMRVNRLETVEAEILANIIQLAKVQEEQTHKHLERTLENTYYRNMYDYYKDNNRKVLELMHKHHVKLSKGDIEKVLTLPWSGDNYSKNIWKREYDIAHKVKRLVTRNILEGKSIQSLTEIVTMELGKDYENAAKRLIHTETTFVKSQGDLLTYEKLGMEKYRFLATLDGKTSDICRKLDGKIFKVSEATAGINYPPMHAWCRSTTTVAKEENTGTRVARDSTGKTYKVPKNMSYQDWYEEYVLSNNTRDNEAEKTYKVIEDASYWKAEEMESYLKSLSQDEVHAIKEYTGDGYKEINSSLRSGKVTDELQKVITSLDFALNKFETHDNIIVYRGTSVRHLRKNFDYKNPEDLIGLIYKDKGYMSTSIFEDTTFGNDVVFEVKTPKGNHGAYLEYLSDFPDEFEFLIKRGTSFTVTKSEYASDDILRITLELIENED